MGKSQFDEVTMGEVKVPSAEYPIRGGIGYIKIIDFPGRIDEGLSLVLKL